MIGRARRRAKSRMWKTAISKKVKSPITAQQQQQQQQQQQCGDTSAAAMAPRPGLRAYGSVEDLPKARAISRPVASVSNASPSRRQGLEVDSLSYAVTEKAPTSRGWVRLAVVCGLAVGAVAGVLRSGFFSHTTSTAYSSVKSFAEVPGGGRPEAAATTAAASDAARAVLLPPLAFTATNFYHLRDGKPAQDYPWLKNVKLIEPHRETTLLVENRREGCSYQWEVRGSSSADEVHTVATGHATIMLFPHLDENMITLLEVNDESGRVTRRLDEVVMVKYVRREIRTLTDDEREELLDAVSAPWCLLCGLLHQYEVCPLVGCRRDRGVPPLVRNTGISSGCLLVRWCTCIRTPIVVEYLLLLRCTAPCDILVYLIPVTAAVLAL